MSAQNTIIKDFQISYDISKNEYHHAIRQNIFLCKEVSNAIQDYVVKENWGEKNRELYHLLDCKFRVGCINKDIKQYKYTNENGEIKEITIFHTGLLRKTDYQHLFLICKKNTQKQPEWMVEPKPKKGCDVMSANNWLLTKNEINEKYGKYGINAPELLNYYKNININDLSFDAYQFQNDLKCNTNDYYKFINALLCNVIRIQSKKKTLTDFLCAYKINFKSYSAKKIANELCESFMLGIKKSIKGSMISNDYIKHGLFINKDKKSFKLDWLMYTEIIYNKRILRFVLRINKNKYNQYRIIDILTLKKAYQCSRQLNKLPNFWWYELYPMEKLSKKQIKNNNYNNNIEHNSYISSTSGDDIPSLINDNSNESSLLHNSSNSSPVNTPINTPDTTSMSNMTFDDIEYDCNNDNINNNQTNSSCIAVKSTVNNCIKWESDIIGYQYNQKATTNSIDGSTHLTKQTQINFKNENKTMIYIENDNTEYITITQLSGKPTEYTRYTQKGTILSYQCINYITKISNTCIYNTSNGQTSFYFDLIE